MNIENLISSLGIGVECIDLDDKISPARIWGDTIFLGLGSQLVVSNGDAIVRYTKNTSKCVYPNACFALHEACHGVFSSIDETNIFAYEFLISRELTGDDRQKWKCAFENCTVTKNGADGWQILSGNMNILDLKEWNNSFKWLESNGYTVGGRPVYGLGQSFDIDRMTRMKKYRKDDINAIDDIHLKKWGIELRY